MLTAARKTKGSHILFIHADADYKTDERARGSRIDPGLNAIDEYLEETASPGDLPTPVPLIPVQETEAWILADTTTLADELSIRESTIKRIIQERPDRLAKPKEVLHEIRRRADVFFIGDRDLYRTIGQRVRLRRRSLLPAYTSFCHDLTTALAGVFRA
jgi:hypothetical protein